MSAYEKLKAAIGPSLSIHDYPVYEDQEGESRCSSCGREVPYIEKGGHFDHCEWPDKVKSRKEMLKLLDQVVEEERAAGLKVADEEAKSLQRLGYGERTLGALAVVDALRQWKKTPQSRKARAKLRPANYASLTPEMQWEVDKKLGLLDWDGVSD